MWPKQNKVAVIFIPHQQYVSSRYSSSSSTLDIVSHLNFRHSKGFLIVALISIFQMISDEHLFTLIFMSPLVKYLFRPFACIKLNCLYYFELKEFFVCSGYKSFIRYMFCEIFSQTVACLFLFSMLLISVLIFIISSFLL